MPRATGKAVSSRTPWPLSRLQIWTLCHRAVLLVPDRERDGRGFEDAGHLVATWEKHRGRLLSHWLSGNPDQLFGLPLPRGRLLTRPWAWWLAEAPGPRRQIGIPEPFHGFDPAAWREHFGLPRGVSLHDPAYESEHDYLLRLDLLEHIERAWLAKNPPTGGKKARGGPGPVM